MRKPKILRLKEAYSLDDLDTALEYQYTVAGKSLRDLADYVNTEVARYIFQDTPYSGEYVYRTLTDEAVSKQERLELKKRLQADGFDLEEIQSEWVSHVPVKTHLNNELDIDTSREQTERSPEEAIDDIRGLLSKEQSIIEELLKTVEGVDVSEWDVHFGIRLIRKESGESVWLLDHLAEMAEPSEHEESR